MYILFINVHDMSDGTAKVAVTKGSIIPRPRCLGWVCFLAQGFLARTTVTQLGGLLECSYQIWKVESLGSPALVWWAA